MDTAEKSPALDSARQVQRLPLCWALIHATRDPRLERRGRQIRFLRDCYQAFSSNLSALKAQQPTGQPR